jgi:hypothetical protein
MRAVIDCHLNDCAIFTLKRSAFGAEQTDWALQMHNSPLAFAKPAGVHPQKGPNAAKPSADFHRKNAEAQQIPLNIASYKLYYVNYKIGLNPRPTHTPAQADFQPPPSLLLLVGGFRGF